MKVLNVQQGSPEWFDARWMTASKAQAIGSCGKGLETYIYEMMAEKLSRAEPERFSNEHTERGNELESQARSLYELNTDSEVKEVGFVMYDDMVGCSPDGLVGKDGLVEFKCPSDKVYLKALVNGIKESAYEWQCQMQMLVTGREWCDLVYYNENFYEDFIVKRIYADKEKFSKLMSGIDIGKGLIKEILKKVN